MAYQESTREKWMWRIVFGLIGVMTALWLVGTVVFGIVSVHQDHACDARGGQLVETSNGQVCANLKELP